ncbi:MAG: radical SAM protein [Myxococcota bacterium]|nr:radical SAM protein [Myxococcota bacterium]
MDSLCIGEGEETFRELVDHLDGGGDRRELGHIAGLRYRDGSGQWVRTDKRSQRRDLDTFPPPARHLIKRYASEYFFTVANPMASISTSRGCSFDCNFCAIWEFYDRRTRYLSAEAICDQLEQIEEPFVFFLDDNFLSKKARLEALAAEIERRGIKKYWGSQGRTDFIADNPETMRRLRDAGLIMLLSGYESNEEDALDALLKRNTVDKNRRAAELMRELGIVSTGIFMIRPDFEEADFDALYAHINELGVAIPLVTVHTPLPGTQLYREREDELLTRDARLYDLLHSVLPTKLSRQRFYEKLTEYNQAVWPSFERGTWAAIRRRPGFFWKARKGAMRFAKKANNYRRIVEDAQSHLRDEIGIIAADVVAEPAVERPLDLLVKTA